MNEVILGSIITVALAACSGLAFIAYKHPNGYRKMCGPLIACIMGLFILRIIYTAGESSGFFQALHDVRSLNKDKLIETPSFEPDPLWIGLIPLGAVLYLTFLLALPSILELPEKDRKENKSDKDVEA